MMMTEIFFIDATNDWTDEERWGQEGPCLVQEQLSATERNAHQPRRLDWLGDR